MRITLALLMLAAATSADAQVVNPDFDTGMTGWAFVLGYGGIVDWDAAAGDPAGGSALAGNIFAGPHRDGWKQCVPFAATDFTISARVASALQTGNRCRIRVDFIANPDCVDGTPIVLESLTGNTLSDGSFETVVAGGALPDGVQAAAVFLEHIRSHDAAAGDSFCHFDHIEVTGGGSIFAATFE
jgi:hypothetical protein